MKVAAINQKITIIGATCHYDNTIIRQRKEKNCFSLVRCLFYIENVKKPLRYQS